MKKFLIVLLAVFCFASLAFAGDQATKSKAGDKALLFSLQGLNNFGLGNFGGGIGVKYFFQDDMAVRAAIGFNFKDTTQKGVGGANDVIHNNINLSFSPAFIYNIATNGPVVVYVGGIAMVSWGHEKYEPYNAQIQGVNYSADKATLSSIAFGFGALAGFEWFPWNNISLSAEYNLMFTISSSRAEITQNLSSAKIDLPSTTNVGLGSTGLLTLGVYF